MVPGMGYPISVVAHPTLHVAYVADMGHAAYNNRCSLDPTAPKRGILIGN